MPTPTVLTRRDLNRAFLARQLLLARDTRPPAEAIEQVAGLQAQLPRPPFIGLWSRLRNFDRAALVDAVLDRRIVRVTAMRGTLHLLSARDYRAWRGALQPALDRGLDSIIGPEAQPYPPGSLIQWRSLARLTREPPRARCR